MMEGKKNKRPSKINAFIIGYNSLFQTLLWLISLWQTFSEEDKIKMSKRVNIEKLDKIIKCITSVAE